VSYPITWVKLEKYTELTGDSMESVNARRKAGKWLDGNQCKIVDGRIWINLPAVEDWVEKWNPIIPSLASMQALTVAKPKKKG